MQPCVQAGTDKQLAAHSSQAAIERQLQMESLQAAIQEQLQARPAQIAEDEQVAVPSSVQALQRPSSQTPVESQLQAERNRFT